MEELIKKYSAIDRCPIRNVISHFSSKWGILILLVLGEAEKLRFNEIYKILPDISPKVFKFHTEIFGARQTGNKNDLCDNTSESRIPHFGRWSDFAPDFARVIPVGLDENG